VRVVQVHGVQVPRDRRKIAQAVRRVLGEELAPELPLRARGIGRPDLAERRVAVGADEEPVAERLHAVLPVHAGDERARRLLASRRSEEDLVRV